MPPRFRAKSDLGLDRIKKQNDNGGHAVRRQREAEQFRQPLKRTSHEANFSELPRMQKRFRLKAGQCLQWVESWHKPSGV
jgi:hypothetical protein